MPASYRPRSDALVVFMREVGGLSMKATAIWPGMITLMSVTVREIVAVDGMGPSLGRFAALKMPTLFLLGSQSDQAHIRDTTLALVDLVPHARLCELRGQGHIAQMLAPHLVATEITAFLNSVGEQA